MKRFVPFFWLALILLAGGTLMQISYQVDAKERELRKLTTQLIAHEDSIRVLKAEWAYLNQPQRLEKLSAKYLALKPVQVAQLQAGLPALQLATATPQTIPNGNMIKVAVTTGTPQ
ncbi:MAG TPA: hypothetical protein PKW15_08770 [Alphaproteobacteria bacterium]|nr:hypothetical protein [Alphaproteobacteria bacterium]